MGSVRALVLIVDSVAVDMENGLLVNEDLEVGGVIVD